LLVSLLLLFLVVDGAVDGAVDGVVDGVSEVVLAANVRAGTSGEVTLGVPEEPVGAAEDVAVKEGLPLLTVGRG
jgi:hypothetical protein